AIDYYLQQPVTAISIEIADAQGKTIATFTGPATLSPAGGRDGAPPPEPDEEGGGRGAAPARVAAKQGMNRFTWDMRYPGARDFPGLIMWVGSTGGPQAPPGKYQVKLTAPGGTRTQDFTIKRNAAIP